MTYSALFPGKWFKTASPQEYLDFYNAILDKLDPRRVVDDLEALGPNPTLLCYESPKDIIAGSKWCHRSICAQWLEDTIGVKVEEVGHPDLPRFRYVRGQHIAAPSYSAQPPTDLLDLLAIRGPGHRIVAPSGALVTGGRRLDQLCGASVAGAGRRCSPTRARGTVLIRCKSVLANAGRGRD
jgi:hypothetical protein